MSNVAEADEEHSIIWGDVHGCDDECGDIQEEEFPGQSKFHQEFRRSHLEEYVRQHRKVGERTRRDCWSGKD